MPTSSERRQQVLDRKRIDYANLVKQYYDTDKDEVYKDIYRQVCILKCIILILTLVISIYFWLLNKIFCIYCIVYRFILISLE